MTPSPRVTDYLRRGARGAGLPHPRHDHVRTGMTAGVDGRRMDAEWTPPGRVTARHDGILDDERRAAAGRLRPPAPGRPGAPHPVPRRVPARDPARSRAGARRPVARRAGPAVPARPGALRRAAVGRRPVGALGPGGARPGRRLAGAAGDGRTRDQPAVARRPDQPRAAPQHGLRRPGRPYRRGMSERTTASAAGFTAALEQLTTAAPDGPAM